MSLIIILEEDLEKKPRLRSEEIIEVQHIVLFHNQYIFGQPIIRLLKMAHLVVMVQI